MYLLALLCPPLAVLLTGRIFQAMFSLLLLPFYFPAALWALLVVSAHKADKRADRVIRAVKPSSTVVTTNVQVNNVINVIVPGGPSDDLVAEIMADRERQAERERRHAEQLAALARKEQRSARLLAIKAAPMRAMWAIEDGIQASTRAYHALPEWAQPITWGLAAGTPVALILAMLLAGRQNHLP